MKRLMRNTFVLGGLLGWIGISGTPLGADTGPEKGYHYVNRSVVIRGLDKFPDHQLIGHVPRSGYVYLVKEGKKLSGHKIGHFVLLGVKTSYLDAIKGVENLKMKKASTFLEMMMETQPNEAKHMKNLPKELLESKSGPDELVDEHLIPCDVDITPEDWYAKDENPIVNEAIEYTLAGVSDEIIHLYKSKHVSEYDDGTPTKVEVFSDPATQKQTAVQPSPKKADLRTPVKEKLQPK